MCLKVNLHSSAFFTSFSYFLGTSTCCQFSPFGGTNAVLLQPLLCFEQSRVQVISSPGNTGRGQLGVDRGAANTTCSPSCWPRCKLGAVLGCLQLRFDSELYRIWSKIFWNQLPDFDVLDSCSFSLPSIGLYKVGETTSFIHTTEGT